MTSVAEGKFGDLGPRLATSVALVVVGVSGVALGGVWFLALVCLVVGLISWELSVMAQSRLAIVVGVTAAACCAGLALLPVTLALPLALVPLLTGQASLQRARLAHGLFLAVALMAGYGLILLRGNGNPVWLVWLVAIVVATDIAGYFAGRLIGGPKFWPAISPKKTWSGTVAGWILAALVGWIVAHLAGLDAGSRAGLVAISVAVSMASQLGDIGESAFKRSVGIKDSSALLPGHGGFFDRFDGVLGASVFFVLIQQVLPFPPVLT